MNSGKSGAQSVKKKSDLLVRFCSGFVYVAVSATCLLAHEWTAVAFLALTAAISVSEFYTMLRSDAKLPNEMVGIIAAALYPVSVFFLGLSGALCVSLLLLLVLIVWYVFWTRARIHDVGVSFFGSAYCGMTLSGLMLIRMALPDPWGGVLALGLFVSVWANDAFAYLVGSKLGKHKLAPRISPKKSWEGFIAGLIASAMFWCLLTLIPGVSMSITQAIIFGVVNGLMGVLGDLAESRIKRNSGFKDSGTLMPGHGGMLDRCDSLFLVSVTSAILLIAGGCIPY